MLELYNNTNSVCAQKVRLALTEKDLQAKEHMQGDQFDPAYLKLNPNGVVPTLVHDGQPIMSRRSSFTTWKMRSRNRR